MQKNGNARMIGIVVVIALFAFITINPGTRPLSSVGYSTAFQNPQISFYGVSYNGHNYLANNPSSLSFDKRLPSTDGVAGDYLPEVDGEMSPIFIPAQSATYMNIFPGISIPTPWTQSQDMYYAPGWQNNPGAEMQNPPQPVATYPWNVTDPNSNTPYMVQMQQWDQKFYCSFSTSWTASNENPAYHLLYNPLESHITNYYNNLWIWFRIDTPVTWYIQGSDGKKIGDAYQAIAEVNMDDHVQMQAKDNKGNNVAVDSAESTNPESAASILYLYYNPFGQASPISSSTSTPSVPETYDGKLLNPAYFVGQTYFAIDLTTFGNYADGINLNTGTITRGDVATFDLDITTFVFGQYTVLNIMSNPGDFGRTTPLTTTVNILSGILGWLTNPVNIGVLTTIGLLILIIIFAPWLLVVLIALVFGGRRR